MRVLNAFVAFYAGLFAGAKWGLLGLLCVVLGALLIDRMLRERTRVKFEKQDRVQNERVLRENRQRLSQFVERGCRFFGNRHEIWEFEHLFDMGLALQEENLADLSAQQRGIIKTRGGFVLAFNRTGWPSDLDEWKARQVLDLVSDRKIKHIPVSEHALQMERQRAQAELKATEDRVAERRAKLKSRRREDFGSGATSVYVIGSTDQSQSKIGLSDNPERRRAGLQTGNPSRLQLHSTYWMACRDDALLLEQRTHRVLRSKGYFQIGEWFNIEAAIADRIIGEVFDALLEQHEIVESVDKVSLKAVESELLQTIHGQTKWSRSKRGNLTTNAFSKRITVFYKRKCWHWVCDGAFSEQNFLTADQAQRAAIAHLGLSQDQMLEIVLNRENTVR